MKKNIFIGILFFLFIFSSLYSTKELDDFIRSRKVLENGKEIVEVVVPGGRPPKDYVPNENGYTREELSNKRNVVMINEVPIFSWSYGCSPTAAAMMAGYYDRVGYYNIYTGITNNGLMPLTNEAWNSSGLQGLQECPLSATHIGLDGRVTRGHVDDYWIEFNNSDDDPYIPNNWQMHNLGDCTADYMGTSQSAWGNSDGSTTFYHSENNLPLQDYSECENDDTSPRKDGCHGLRQFFESRGYQITTNYTQRIFGYEGVSEGFTYEQYKEEIDNDKPVILHVVGHSMLGVGYNSSNNTIYIHNTWDHSIHAMEWGSIYREMEHYGVTVVNLEPIQENNIVVSGNNNGEGSVDPDPIFVDGQDIDTQFEFTNGTDLLNGTVVLDDGSVSGISNAEFGFTINLPISQNVTITLNYSGLINIPTALYASNGGTYILVSDAIFGLGTVAFTYDVGRRLSTNFVLSSGDQTLPVELSSFTVEQTEDKYAVINWVTQSETELFGYNIYRSNEENFEEAIKINATIQEATNEPIEHFYSYIDNSVYKGLDYYYWLEAIDYEENISHYGPISFRISLTDIVNSSLKNTKLFMSSPNPFNPVTTIKFVVRKNEKATLTIYNVKGQLVKSYDKFDAGEHEIIWEGKDNTGRALSSGVYFYRLQSESYNSVKRMILMK